MYTHLSVLLSSLSSFLLLYSLSFLSFNFYLAIIVNLLNLQTIEQDKMFIRWPAVRPMLDVLFAFFMFRVFGKFVQHILFTT